MSRYGDKLVDENGVPIQGASIYVYDSEEQLVTLEDDAGNPLSNPLTSDEDGNYHFVAPDGLYILEFRYGGRLRRRDESVILGQPPIFKGEPGGNVMAIGTFLDAASLTIPEGADLVHTSGYSSPSDGGAARYAYDATVDAAYVTTYPYTAFIDAAGRGFRIVEPMLTPRMFGALGDGTDDVVSLQAMEHHSRPFVNRRRHTYNYSGEWHIGDTLWFSSGLNDSEQVPVRIVAPRLRVLPLASLPGGLPLSRAVVIAGRRQLWSGRLEIYPSGVGEYATPWTQRRYDVAVWIGGVQMSELPSIHTDDTRYDLVVMDSSAPFKTEEGTAFEVNYVDANNIGSFGGAIFGRYFGSTHQSSAIYGFKSPLTGAIVSGSYDDSIGDPDPADFVAGFVDNQFQRSKIPVDPTNYRIADWIKMRHVIHKSNTGMAAIGDISFDSATSEVRFVGGDAENDAAMKMRVGSTYTVSGSGHVNNGITFEVMEHVAANRVRVHPTAALTTAAADANVQLIGEWTFRRITSKGPAELYVFPNMPPNVNSEVYLIAGCALKSIGGDNSTIRWKQVKGLVSPIIYQAAALYGGSVPQVLADFAEIGIIFGGLAYGQSILENYLPQAHLEAVQLGVLVASGGAAGTVGNVDVSNCRGIHQPIEDEYQFDPRQSLASIRLITSTYEITPSEQEPYEGTSFDSFMVSNRPDRRNRRIRADSATVTLHFDRVLMAQQGEHNWAIVRWGTPNGGAPTGTLTVNLSDENIAAGLEFIGGGTSYSITAPGTRVKLEFEALITGAATPTVDVLRFNAA